MKTYLVGGAVRDQLLGLPITDRDWVVTGATPEDMIRKGFKPVGLSFPVFLHPQTGEEYALARKERKAGHGYNGFICDFDPSITLEEDLSRRDLTINAMAIDKSGHLVDPYGGEQDLDNRILRHVSAAFSEDPLRVLRAARFLCRFASLGFTIEAGTQQLIANIAATGELEHLTKERAWKEFERALGEQSPLQFFHLLYATNALKSVFTEFAYLFETATEAIIDSHTSNNTSDIQPTIIQQLDNVITQLDSPLERWGCFFYFADNFIPNDNTRNEHIRTLCNQLKAPNTYYQIAQAVTNCTSLLMTKTTLDSADILSLFHKTDAYRQPELFKKTIRICNAFKPLPHALPFYTQLLVECRALSAQPFIEQGLKGKQIGKALDNARQNFIAHALTGQPTHQPHVTDESDASIRQPSSQ